MYSLVNGNFSQIKNKNLKYLVYLLSDKKYLTNKNAVNIYINGWNNDLIGKITHDIDFLIWHIRNPQEIDYANLILLKNLNIKHFAIKVECDDIFDYNKILECWNYTKYLELYWRKHSIDLSKVNICSGFSENKAISLNGDKLFKNNGVTYLGKANDFVWDSYSSCRFGHTQRKISLNKKFKYLSIKFKQI